MSVEEGKVDEELKRAEEDEFSWLDVELLVPPLPLLHISMKLFKKGGARSIPIINIKIIVVFTMRKAT